MKPTRAYCSVTNCGAALTKHATSITKNRQRVGPEWIGTLFFVLPGKIACDRKVLAIWLNCGDCAATSLASLP